MKLPSNILDFPHRYLRIPYRLHVVEFRSPKKPKATFILLHGIGNSTKAWENVVKQMPKDVRIIAIDLLGFGGSPKPAWATYDAKQQARSIGATIMRMRLRQRPIIVGHSLGALVAIHIAKKYSFAVKRLVLCSPPLYNPAEGKAAWRDTTLRSLYTIALKHPEQLQKLAPLAVKLGIANPAFSLTNETAASYATSLRTAIINQTSLAELSSLQLPVDILYGVFDPVVIDTYFTALQTTHPNISVKRVVAGHEVMGIYAKTLVTHLQNLIVAPK